jgi:hypothetical protein
MDKKQKIYENKWPVFTMGQPRSGTTLMHALISALDEVVGYGYETRGLLGKPHSNLSVEDSYNQKIINPDSNLKISLQALFLSKPQAKRWAEKTPAHILCADEIWELFKGECFFICMQRNGRDACTSIHHARPGEYWLSPENWLRYSEAINRTFLNHEKNTVLVKYEHLVCDPISTMHRVFRRIQAAPQPTFWEDWKKETFTSNDLILNVRRDGIEARKERAILPAYDEVMAKFDTDPALKKMMWIWGYDAAIN